MTYSTSTERLMSIHLAISQYPILSSRIRARMRRELFDRGIYDSNGFEAEVRRMALQSQEMEGLLNPYAEEPNEVWEKRLTILRDHLTDLSFSSHLGFDLFQRIVNEVLGERGINVEEVLLSINPELAPIETVFEHAMTIERLPPQERSRFEARLLESKVVLIRSLISDQLRYINIAKEWFNLQDLAEIRRRRIGSGRIGGKAAGMLLATRILMEVADPPLKECLRTPESFFIGSDELYTFMSINNLHHWNDQKYKNEEEMRNDYPAIEQEFLEGVFPPDIVERLQVLLAEHGSSPLIVRSSSLLEDNFGTSFAGKYESVFLPNQGKPAENLSALTRAIARVYASTLNPNALLYRRNKGLQDFDERMAILIQVVVGERYKTYYMPYGAGVAFSRNLYRWAPQIRREDGFVRLVWGLGTRAVDRVGNDYPRLVALSHPLLRPNNEAKSIRRYSQQYVDVIDLEANAFRTLPVHEVLDSHYPPLRYLAQLDEDGYFSSLRSTVVDGDPRRLVLTFEEFLRRTPFAERMREVLKLLEKNYRAPVDMEFAFGLSNLDSVKPNLDLIILQCRPQSHLQDAGQITWPKNLTEADTIFSTNFVVPSGLIPQVDYVAFVPPEAYFALTSERARITLARTVGHLNAALGKENFICVGPGRWGSSNSDLGVSIDYGDIYHSRALVEMAGPGIGPAPEPSLGTHFFQDLLEAQIYPLAVVLDDPHTVFNQRFFNDMPNHTAEWINVEDDMLACLRLIRVADFRPGSHIRVVMDDDKGQAIAYLESSE